MAKKKNLKNEIKRTDNLKRAQPSAPTAGYLASGRRYDKGGKRK